VATLRRSQSHLQVNQTAYLPTLYSVQCFMKNVIKH